MAKKFMGDDFLLQNELAVKLYNEIKDLPIIDYHCHLIPQQIAENKKFKNITEIWLGGDHYKWRLMRSFGIEEKYITGDADDYEKFVAWARTIENAFGNPLYHWTHLELKRYFDCDLLLSEKTAKEVWEQCNKVISSPAFSVWNIFEKFHVESLCTTDDPIDSLEYHKQIKAAGIKTIVLPTFRPNFIMNPAHEKFVSYVKTLGELASIDIKNYADIRNAMYNRIEYFHANGGRLSDHSLDEPAYVEATADELDVIVAKALAGEAVCNCEIQKYSSMLYRDLGLKYGEMGWTMQVHMNAQRNNNTRMFGKLGADTGFDCIMDSATTRPIARLLDSLATEDKLPKTVLYSLNPSNDDALAAMIGNFQGGGVKGKMQHGSAWWFNDTKSGMQKQMIALANMGLLAAFIGMLTDSRSFLSYTRHEYFRRVMVNLIVGWVEAGEVPEDFDKLAEICKGISYCNAKNYFNF